MTPAEERIAIEKVLNGDSAAFEALVTENQKKVYNLALRMTGNENDALDLSQEAFIKAYTGLKSFRIESRFSVWLYRMTYNVCIDFLRKKQRQNTVSLTYASEEDEETETEIPDFRYNPENETVRRELREAIEKGLGQLSEEHRVIFTLRDMHDMSYAEIACILDISEGTVKSRLSRARQSLVRVLVRNGTFPESGSS